MTKNDVVPELIERKKFGIKKCDCYQKKFKYFFISYLKQLGWTLNSMKNAAKMPSTKIMNGFNPSYNFCSMCFFFEQVIFLLWLSYVKMLWNQSKFHLSFHWHLTMNLGSGSRKICFWPLVARAVPLSRRKFLLKEYLKNDCSYSFLIRYGGQQQGEMNTRKY